MWKKPFSAGMFALNILILLSSVVNFGTCCCEQKERISNLLDAAMDLLSKAKSENISCPEEHNLTNWRPLDCADLYRKGYNKSGVYTIWPVSRLTSMKGLGVFCDMVGGGWTVIQRRGYFGRADDFFNQDWEGYKKGFGNLKTDFWLGNDNIFAMTNQRQYSVYFALADKQQNKAFAHYDNFWIDDEFNNYTLHISGYSGTAGDAMHFHNNKMFGTKDRNNGLWIKGNCGLRYKSGWWFTQNCYHANLNGMYNNQTDGIAWRVWKKTEDLSEVEIKIKPTVF